MQGSAWQEGVRPSGGRLMRRMAHAPHVLQPTRPSAQPCHLRKAQQAVLAGAWWVAAREAARDL